MNSEITHPSLLSRVRDGSDNEAWAEFQSKYAELIRRYCLRRGLSAADADDVHQMAMLRLMRTLPAFTYDPRRGRFRDYLYRTVRSVVSDMTARPESAPRAVDMGVLVAAPAPGGSDELWEQEWADHHYRLALRTIRGDFAGKSLEMFERLMTGSPVEAVAEAFGTTAQAVHKVKQRVRDRLRELIEAQIAEEDRI